MQSIAEKLVQQPIQAIDIGVFRCERVLKRDAYGQIELGEWHGHDGTVRAVRRVYTKNLVIRPVARVLAANERRALKRLRPLWSSGQIPALLAELDGFHVRSFIEADVLHDANGVTPEFYSKAKTLLRTVRRLGVCHNDLAKSANWLVRRGSNDPALVDFQLAFCFPFPNAFSAMCNREDLRHLLKQKSKMFGLTARESKICAKKSVVARVWMKTGKVAYHAFTRKVLGWKDRTGPEERDF